MEIGEKIFFLPNEGDQLVRGEIIDIEMIDILGFQCETPVIKTVHGEEYRGYEGWWSREDDEESFEFLKDILYFSTIHTNN
jgi:hypothetical protein